jgi:hypothetical protein
MKYLTRPVFVFFGMECLHPHPFSIPNIDKVMSYVEETLRIMKGDSHYFLVRDGVVGSETNGSKQNLISIFK